MLSAKRRLNNGVNNQDRDEYLYAITFYSVFALACLLFVFALTKLNTILVGSLFWATSILVITSFIVSILYTTSDYKKNENIHNRTLEYFISDINLAKENPLIKHGYKTLLFFVEIFYTIFAIKTYNQFSIMWIYYLLFINYALGAIFLIFDGKDLADKKVSPSTLKSFENLEDMSMEEKACFKRSCQAIIEKNSFIKKTEVFFIASKLMEYRDKRLQDEIFELEKASNKEEYQDYMRK